MILPLVKTMATWHRGGFICTFRKSGPCHSLCCVLWLLTFLSCMFLSYLYIVLRLWHLHINLHQRAPTFHAKAEANCRRGTISILNRLVVGTGPRILILLPQSQASFSPSKVVFLKSILSKNQTINLSSPKKKTCTQIPKMQIGIMLLSMTHGFPLSFFFVWSLPISHGARPDSSSRRPPNLEDQIFPPGLAHLAPNQKMGGGGGHVYI